MASDFAMGRFRFLERLLLVHGHWSYARLARMMLYFFYKNIVRSLLLVFVHYDVHVHVLVNERRRRKEGRKKQGRLNKQQSKAIHTQGSHLSKEKLAASGGIRTQMNIYYILHVNVIYKIG